MGLINIAWIADARATTFCSLCVFIVILRTGKDIFRHWQHRNKLCNYLRFISIMIMVPLYAILSFLSLLFPEYTVYFDIIRDSYEGYALYACFCLYVDLLGHKQSVKQLLESHNSSIYHHLILKLIFKSNWLKKNIYDDLAWSRNSMYEKCKYCILQYCIIKPIISFISCILYYYGLFTYADFRITKNAYFSFLIISFISIGIAFYFLGLFCDSLKDELKIHKPLKKFLCIKIIILFSFWQESIFDILIYYNILDPGNNTREYIIATIHDFAMCLELVPFAIFHHHVFGYKTIFKEFDAKTELQEVIVNNAQENNTIEQKNRIQKYKENIIFEILYFLKSYKIDVMYIFVGLIFSFIYALLGTANFNIQDNGLAYINYAISIALFSDANNTYPITQLGELVVMFQRIINFVMIVFAIKATVQNGFALMDCLSQKCKNIMRKINYVINGGRQILQFVNSYTKNKNRYRFKIKKNKKIEI
jgi:hypothetical protein